MNVCFIIGKIISEIKFDFILNSKNLSIAKFDVELENRNIIKVIGYNNIADFCYSKLIKGDLVGVLGYITSEGIIVIDEIDVQ